MQALDEAVVGLFTDCARVEHEHICLFLALRLPHAGSLKHALDALGVVHVHLTAERGDVKATHGV